MFRLNFICLEFFFFINSTAFIFSSAKKKPHNAVFSSLVLIGNLPNDSFANPFGIWQWCTLHDRYIRMREDNVSKYQFLHTSVVSISVSFQKVFIRAETESQYIWFENAESIINITLPTLFGTADRTTVIQRRQEVKNSAMPFQQYSGGISFCQHWVELIYVFLLINRQVLKFAA